jgi:hypothetical protein
MKFKKEYIILLVVILGLSVYLYSRQSDRTLYQLPELSEVAAKKISKIEITGPEVKIVLNKADETWTIGSEAYLAADNKVRQMLESIEQLTLTALISESKNYVRYDLTEDQKISVKAWSGGTLSRAFDIGKTDSSLKHTFVMLAEDPKVYQAGSNIRSKFDQNIEDIRDKSVMSFSTDNIKEIQLVQGDRSVTLKREQAETPGDAADQKTTTPKAVWKTPDGKKADGSKVNELLSTLSNLDCDTYITDRAKADFSGPTYTVKLQGEKDYAISLYVEQEKEEKNYSATSSENKYPFRLPEWRAKNLMPDLDELFSEKEKS